MKTTLVAGLLSLSLCLAACGESKSQDEAQATSTAMAKELERFSLQKEYQAKLSQAEKNREQDQARLQYAIESGAYAPMQVDEIKDTIRADDALIVSLKSKISALETHH